MGAQPPPLPHGFAGYGAHAGAQAPPGPPPGAPPVHPALQHHYNAQAQAASAHAGAAVSSALAAVANPGAYSKNNGPGLGGPQGPPGYGQQPMTPTDNFGQYAPPSPKTGMAQHGPPGGGAYGQQSFAVFEQQARAQQAQAQAAYQHQQQMAAQYGQQGSKQSMAGPGSGAYGQHGQQGNGHMGSHGQHGSHQNDPRSQASNQPGSGTGDPSSQATLVSESMGVNPSGKQYTDYLEMQLFKTKPIGPNLIMQVPKKILNLIAFHKNSRCVRNVFTSSSDPDQVNPFSQNDVFMKFEYLPTEKDRDAIAAAKEDKDGKHTPANSHTPEIQRAINKTSGLAEFWVEDKDGLMSALNNINSSMPTQVYVHVYRNTIEHDKTELANKLLKLCSEGLVDLSKLKHDIRRRDEARRLGIPLGREDNSPQSASKQEELDRLLNKQRAHLGSFQSLSNANTNNIFDYYTIGELYAWLPYLSTIGEDDKPASEGKISKAYSDATSWAGAGGEDGKHGLAATFVSCKTSGLKCYSSMSDEYTSLMNMTIPFGARFHMLVKNEAPADDEKLAKTASLTDSSLRMSNGVSDALTKRKELRMRRRQQRELGQEVSYEKNSWVRVSFREQVFFVKDREDRDYVEEREFTAIRRRIENDMIVRYYTEEDPDSRDTLHRMAGKMYSHAFNFESPEGKSERERDRAAWQRREDDLRRGRSRKAEKEDETGLWYHPHDEIISVLDVLETWTELASWEMHEAEEKAAEEKLFSIMGVPSPNIFPAAAGATQGKKSMQ